MIEEILVPIHSDWWIGGTMLTPLIWNMLFVLALKYTLLILYKQLQIYKAVKTPIYDTDSVREF